MEEEKICRICRCPAEEDNELFYPCGCSGSMKYVHNDCMLQWLKHSSREEKCDLCGKQLQFKKSYRDDAPVVLSICETAKLSLRKCVRLLPLFGRFLIAFFLWIIVAPYFVSEMLLRGSMYGTFLGANKGLYSIEFDFWYWELGVSIIGVNIFGFLFFFISVIHFVYSARAEREELARDVNNAEAILAPEQRQDHPAAVVVPPLPVPVANVDGNHRFNNNENNPQAEENNQQQQQQQQEQNQNNENDQQQQQQQQEEQNPNNENNQQDDGDVDDDDGLGGGDAEINGRQAQGLGNLPLMNILGLRGAFKSLFVNFFILISFQFSILSFGLTFPGFLGGYFLSLLDHLSAIIFSQHILPYPEIAIPFMLRRKTYGEEEEGNGDEDITIESDSSHEFQPINKQVILSPEEQMKLLQYPRILEFVCVVTGIVLLLVGISFAKMLTFGITDPASSRGIMGRRRAILVISDLAKVSTLLLTKMVAFPIGVGLQIEWTARKLFKTNINHFEFANNNPLLAAGFLWVVGISNMLVLTITIHHMREILHPEVLDGIVRPHDPKANMLKTLFQEPVTKHIKRLCISTVMYSSSVVLFVALPISLLEYIGAPLPLPLNFNYYLEGIQVPIELVATHFFTLFALRETDRRLCHLHRYFIVKMCFGLNLAEQLLPIPKDMKSAESNEHLEKSLLDNWPPENIKQALKEQDRGLRIRKRHWLEPKPVIPLALLSERKRPSFYYARLFVFFVVWCIARVITFFIGLSFPILLGKGFVRILDIPFVSNHDVYVCGVGFLLTWIILTTASSMKVTSFEKLFTVISTTANNLIAANLADKFVFLQTYFIVPLQLGILLEVLLQLYKPGEENINIQNQESPADLHETAIVAATMIQHFTMGIINRMSLFRDWCVGVFICIVAWKLIRRRLQNHPELLIRLLLQDLPQNLRLIRPQYWASRLMKIFGYLILIPYFISMTLEVAVALNQLSFPFEISYFLICQHSMYTAAVAAFTLKFVKPKFENLGEVLRDEFYLKGRRLVNVDE